MFAIGDGAGVSRGLVQASASGVIAARAIMKRICGASNIRSINADTKAEARFARERELAYQ